MKKEIKNILQYTDIKGNSLEKYFRKPLENKKTDGLNLSFKPSVPGGEVKTSFNILITQNNLQNTRFSLIVPPHPVI